MFHLLPPKLSATNQGHGLYFYLSYVNLSLCDCVQFAGKWYRLGLAYDSPHFAPYRDKLKASMGIVTALTNGNVNLSMWDAT